MSDYSDSDMEGVVDSSSERVSAAFHYFDRDADGRLTPAEFREALQAAGLAPSQKEFEGLLVESGSSISYVSFKKAIDLLGKPEKALTQKRFIKKFENLLEYPADLKKGKGKIPMDLLEYICHSCQPTAGSGYEGYPVDQLTTEEIEYVLSMVEPDRAGNIKVQGFADELMAADRAELEALEQKKRLAVLKLFPKLTEDQLQRKADKIGISFNDLGALKRKFDTYDTGRSGYIDRSELEGLLLKTGLELTEQELSQAFNLLDADKTGQIEFWDFAGWYTEFNAEENKPPAKAAPAKERARRSKEVEEPLAKGRAGPAEEAGPAFAAAREGDAA